MTFLGYVLILCIWYVIMGIVCNLVAWKNGSLRDSAEFSHDGKKFKMWVVVLFVFIFWPYLMYRNYRYPDKYQEFYDES